MARRNTTLWKNCSTLKAWKVPGDSAGTGRSKVYEIPGPSDSDGGTAADFESALKAIQSELAATPLFDEVNTFASAVAGEMKQRALSGRLSSVFS